MLLLVYKLIYTYLLFYDLFTSAGYDATLGRVDSPVQIPKTSANADPLPAMSVKSNENMEIREPKMEIRRPPNLLHRAPATEPEINSHRIN